MIGIFPIGIDVGHVEERRKSKVVKEKIAAIREMYADKMIIIGRDKLDQTKGVRQKLLAFEKFLQEYPEWRGRVVLIQVTSPPQRDTPKLETKVSELVSRINGTYGSLEFAPVHHYHQHIDRDEYYALLSVADIGLITSVRDGMNTTSHEFVVCQQENKGPLILSEFTGTAGSLSSSLQVNPWDYVGVADMIEEALVMSPEEKETRQKQLYSHVAQFTAQYWARRFVKEARACLNLPDKSNTTPRLNANEMCQKYQPAKKRLLMFDYDVSTCRHVVRLYCGSRRFQRNVISLQGTLTPIRKLPKAAVPPENMLAALKKLAQDPRNIVFVISGRDQAALDEWLGAVPNLGLSAEHGCFVQYPGTGREWINLSETVDLSWKNDVIEIFTYYTERTQGSFIEHKRCSLTWHYRLADPESFQAKECQNHLENAVLSKLPVEILVGKKNLEVRPVSINKGEIVKRLLAQYPDTEFVFCAGDDKTDEDMFRVLRHISVGATPPNSAVGKMANCSGSPVEGGPDKQPPHVYTCTIGPSKKMTLASWHVQSPEELVRVMERMTQA
ncbi:MAG: glycosyltransferase family 20-domain-containing protein [Olpidium bornovanus]|uniref:Glycosyltransferase family 20-domain-containing protein n=1 Tax=Olpidium bornovanus TaxID=278681 RepID=A0A8H7ZQ72_9FUNG|nr:MAG: glycosyltransferase family 20-domain-containing protein [Olpidium bornovanus]